MNIAFTGSHSTGKTTLLNNFIHNFSGNVVSITEVARNIISNGFPLGKDANIDSYINYVNEQLKEEEKIKKTIYDICISDRTLLDPVAYSNVNCNLPRPYIPLYLLEMLERVWLLEKKFYDIYVYFPIEFGMVVDGVRPEDELYRKDVDRKIIELLTRYNINYIKITGSVQERTDQLFSIIQQAY